MRRLRRTALSPSELDWLAQQTQMIMNAADRYAESTRLWDQCGGHNTMRSIREKLHAMASGRERCMYCEDSEGHAIDHFVPRRQAPEEAFTWENLLYACAHCNSNFKRERFPRDGQGQPLLIDPTSEDPLEHLVLTPTTGKFLPRAGSSKGQPSIETFGLSRDTLETGRRDAWVVVQALIVCYDACLTRGHASLADDIRRSVGNASFSCVLVYLLRTAALSPVPRSARIDPECLAALRRRPEIATWPAV